MEEEDNLKLVGMVVEDRQLAVEMSMVMVDNQLNLVGMKSKEMELGNLEVRKEQQVLASGKEQHVLVGL